MADEVSDHKQRVRAQFGATAQSYVASERHRSGNDLQRLVEVAEPHADDDALDVATGGGHTALALAPHVRHVVASDLTPLMLAAAEEFISGQGITNVSYEIAEAERMPFADGAFAIVSCRIAPHHFEDVAAFCREVARVLTPGGRFVLIDSYAPDEPELDAFINTVEWRRDKTHVRGYTIPEWRGFVESAGLIVDLVEPFQRRYPFVSWTERSRMTPEERAALNADMRGAPAHVREHFHVTERDGMVEEFDDNKLLLRARKP